MKRLLSLYFITLALMVAFDALWLGVVAHEFYMSELGNLLAFRPLPGILFYLIYAAGLVHFVNGPPHADWQEVARNGAFFGLVAYATYDLTNLATLQGWPEAVSIVDLAWGTFNSAISATLGWAIVRHISKPKA